nr:transposase [Sorangium cellulosum]
MALWSASALAWLSPEATVFSGARGSRPVRTCTCSESSSATQEYQSAAAPRHRARSPTKSRCAPSLDGFTLHAATRAGAHHAAAREALLRYVLRPPIAQERVELRQDGLARLSLKRAFADGTVGG